MSTVSSSEAFLATSEVRVAWSKVDPGGG